MIMGQVMVRKLSGFLLLIAMMFGAPAIVHAQDNLHTAEGLTAAMPDGAGVHAAHEGHADEHGEHDAGHAPELPTVVHVINSIHLDEGRTVGNTGFGKFIKNFEKQIYLIFWTSLTILGFFSALRLAAHRPGKMQTFLEMLVEGLTNFFTGIVGKEHRKHVPFLCSLFLFIWINNLTALIPGFGPATSKYPTTVTLALLVFFYFIFYGIKDGGLGHFLWHLAGSPKDIVGWMISPVMFVLEVVGTLAKPLSLSLRLFGNIMGEDVLLGVFLILGIMMAGAVVPDPIIGVPLHLPFLFLVLLGSTIQALVFSLLAAIYLAMVLPHHDHEHDEEYGAKHPEDSHPLLPGAEEKNENSGSVDAGVVPFA